jgi:hypothetical protein
MEHSNPVYFYDPFDDTVAARGNEGQMREGKFAIFHFGHAFIIYVILPLAEKLGSDPRTKHRRAKQLNGEKKLHKYISIYGLS